MTVYRRFSISCNKASTRASGGRSYVKVSTAYSIAGNTIDRKIENGGNGKGVNENVSFTLNTIDRHAVCYAVENHPNDSRVKLTGDVVQTLSGRMGTGGGNVPLVLQKSFPTTDYSGFTDNHIGATLKACGGSYGGGSENLVVEERKRWIVRRLTPTECEHLQGFPSGWTAGHSDSARYKALGNSVAVPCVEFIMRMIKGALEIE